MVAFSTTPRLPENHTGVYTNPAPSLPPHHEKYINIIFFLKQAAPPQPIFTGIVAKHSVRDHCSGTANKGR